MTGEIHSMIVRAAILHFQKLPLKKQKELSELTFLTKKHTNWIIKHPFYRSTEEQEMMDLLESVAENHKKNGISK